MLRSASAVAPRAAAVASSSAAGTTARASDAPRRRVAQLSPTKHSGSRSRRGSSPNPCATARQPPQTGRMAQPLQAAHPAR